MHPVSFGFPAPGTSITKGPGRNTLAARNLSTVQGAGHGHLDFMLQPNKGGGFNPNAMYNKRSPLPVASKIIAFNRKRKSKYSARADNDMRTDDERKWGATKKPSLSKLNLSRNHKVPDKFLGTLMQHAVISSHIDSAAQAKASKKALLAFGARFLKPLDGPLRQKTYDTFKDNIDVLTSGGPMSANAYRKHFDAAKRTLSASPANLRLGRSPYNSGIGESLDWNSMRSPASLVRPASPISEHFGDTVEQVLTDFKLPAAKFMFASISTGEHATSSFMTL